MRINKSLSVLGVLLAFAGASAFAFDPQQPCKHLPKGTVLQIGCTDECGGSVEMATEEAAKKLRVKVDFKTMYGDADLQEVDAFLSPGGHDIDPKYYNKNLTPAQKKTVQDLHDELGNDGQKSPLFDERDALEAKILNKYTTDPRFEKLPFLGICYGMQMLAANQGIPLVVDIPRQLSLPARRESDQITLGTESVLNNSPSSIVFSGKKNHHQAVDMKYWSENSAQHPNVKITGTSNGNKIAEVLELKNRPALGIQYHAEETADAKARLAPFTWFVKEACRNKSASLTKMKSKPNSPRCLGSDRTSRPNSVH